MPDANIFMRPLPFWTKPADAMPPLTKTLTIINEKGLHARCAALFAETVRGFPDTSVTVEKDGVKADGISVLSLLTLSASQGAEITIRASGKNAEDVLDALTALVEGGCAEKTGQML